MDTSCEHTDTHTRIHLRMPWYINCGNLSFYSGFHGLQYSNFHLSTIYLFIIKIVPRPLIRTLRETFCWAEIHELWPKSHKIFFVQCPTNDWKTSRIEQDGRHFAHVKFKCTWWRHQLEIFSALLAFCEVTKSGDAELWCLFGSAPE